jgi:hypothetical protein
MEPSAAFNGSTADQLNQVEKKRLRPDQKSLMRREPAVPHSELTCRQFVSLIGKLRDGELSEVDRRSFFDHRRKCARCSEYLKGYELTITVIKKASEDLRDPGETTMPKSLVRKILDRRS